jgi:glucose-6-phosphate isomerase
MNNKVVFPLSYDPSAVMLPGSGLSWDDLSWLSPRLDAARREVLEDLDLWHSGAPVPKRKEPLDAAFMDLPDRLLQEYRTQGDASEVGRILATARRLSELVDRVAILGIGGSYMGARAMFDACCHPYYNELTRAQRGGRPRIYFEGNNVDNDSLAGLIDLLGDKPATGVDDRWAIVVISKSGGTLETAAAFRVLLRLLRKSCGDNLDEVRRLVVPVTGQTGRLRDLSNALGLPETFPIPDGVGGRFSVLSAVGLLPAALMGLDIVELLEGAAAMNQRFRNAPVNDNPVLRYVGVSRLMEIRRGAAIRVLSSWGKRLEAVGLWYDQLLAESLGKDAQGATPLTVVNTRDLHSRGQQHQEGRRDKLITNLIVERPQRDWIKIGYSDFDQDKLNELAEKAFPEVLHAALVGTNKAYLDDRRPTADLQLQQLNESSLGQLFQMLMLATIVEGRLMGVNPYGQPGVEGYKKNMNAYLRGR